MENLIIMIKTNKKPLTPILRDMKREFDYNNCSEVSKEYKYLMRTIRTQAYHIMTAIMNSPEFKHMDGEQRLRHANICACKFIADKLGMSVTAIMDIILFDTLSNMMLFEQALKDNKD